MKLRGINFLSSLNFFQQFAQKKNYSKRKSEEWAIVNE